MHTIIRVRHSQNFTVISNDVLTDPALDFHALGFLCYLLSKPDDWNIRAMQLAMERNVSKYAIYRALGKLEKAGYVSHYQEDFRLPNGTFKRRSTWMVFEDKAQRTEVPYFEARYDHWQKEEGHRVAKQQHSQP